MTTIILEEADSQDERFELGGRYAVDIYVGGPQHLQRKLNLTVIEVYKEPGRYVVTLTDDPTEIAKSAVGIAGAMLGASVPSAVPEGPLIHSVLRDTPLGLPALLGSPSLPSPAEWITGEAIFHPLSPPATITGTSPTEALTAGVTLDGLLFKANEAMEAKRIETESAEAASKPKKRGRPKGSKNKPKPPEEPI